MNNVTRWRGESARPPAPPAEWMAPAAFHDPEPSAIIHALFSNFRLIAAVTLIGAALSFVVLKALPPQFTASALIMLDSRSTLLDETQSMFAGLPIADTYIESEIEMIRSDAIVYEVIREEGLLADPEFEGGALPAGIERMISKRAGGDAAEQAEATELASSVKLLQAAKEVRKRLDVSRRGLSQAIVVSFRSKSQVKARDMANAFAESYVGDQLSNKLSASRRATDWLKAELVQLAEETQAAEAAVEDYRKQNTLVGEGEQGMSTQQLRLLNEKLAAAKAEVSETQVTVNELRRLREAGQSALLLPEIGETKTIVDLRQQLSEAERAEAELASRFNPEKRDVIPPYQEAHSRTVAARDALNREAARAIQAVEARLASSQAVARTLESELQGLRNDSAQVNAASVGLNELEREAEGKRQRYETLLAEYNKTDNIAAAQTPHARIVSPAELPLTPSAPRKAAAFGAAIVFSAAFGFLIALMRELTRRSIRTPEELHAATGLRPAGVIPRLRTRNRDIAAAMNAVVRAPNADYAEALRSLRAELSFRSGHNGGSVVAVTAPDSGVNTATTAASLARSIATIESNALLVDADLRQPEMLAKLRSRYDGPDFAAVLRGQADWRDAVLMSRNPRLAILAARPGVWDEAVSHSFSGRFQELIDEWRETYGVIVIHAPPALAVPETRVIGKCADEVILCVGWNASDRRRVVEALDLLHEAGSEPRPVLVNVARRLYRRIAHVNAPSFARGGQLHAVRA